MDKIIKETIIDYVKKESSKKGLENLWEEPLVSFAAVDDPKFLKLKTAVSKDHLLPRDLMKEATVVVAYFIPFSEELASENIHGNYSSNSWAVAYLETNELIGRINALVHQRIRKHGFSVSEIPATRNFDEEKLISNWSHRHVAYIAGLGAFGINNLLITEKGSCGRIGTFVTDAKVDPSVLQEKAEALEACLYKHNKSCRKCVERCVNGSLHVKSFERRRCYELLLYNDRLHRMGGQGEVCGKCNVDLPCSHKNPLL